MIATSAKIRTMVVVGLSALMLLAVAAPGGAKSRPTCAIKHGRVLYTNLSGQLVERTVKTKTDPAAKRLYVCSFTYGRRVFLGTYQQTGDGESVFLLSAINWRYAAIADGGAGNAGGASATRVRAIDLQSGATVSNDRPSDSTHQHWVTALAVNQRGAVAWINQDIADSSGVPPAEVHIHDHAGARVLARGPDIVSDYLEFSLDGTTVEWASSAQSAAVN